MARFLLPLFLLLSLRLVAAEAAVLSAPGYCLRVWQTEDGLPQNAVTSLAQSHDGYLWIGTYGGLARFDGVRFDTFDPATAPGMAERLVVGLYEDRDKTLWIGHRMGALTRYRDGRFSTIGTSDKPENEGIRAMDTDEQGTLWALHGSGSLEAVGQGKRIELLPPSTAAGAVAWTRSRQGIISILINGDTYQLSDGSVRRLPLPNAARNPWVLAIASAGAGGLWVVRDGQILRCVEGSWVESRGVYPWTDDSVTCALELRDGTLAFGTLSSGLFLIYPDGRPAARFDQGNGLPQNWIRCILEDRDGNLWAGAGSGGLVCIHSTAISRLDPPDHWKGRSVLSVIEARDGTRWFGTEGAGIYRWQRGVWTTFDWNDGLKNSFVWSLGEDRAGRLWAGTWTNGPMVLRDGKFEDWGQAEGVQGPIQAIWPNPHDDEILIGARNGLLQFRHGEPQWLLRTDGSYSHSISAVVRDASGDIWMGMSKDGLGRLRDGNLTRFGAAQGIGADVFCLHSDGPGTLWAGTENGLVRVRENRIDKIAQAQGLLGSPIGHILDDGLGYYWVSSKRGLQRIKKEDLHACADGKLGSLPSRTFDRNDGLPTVEFTAGLQPAATRTLDGSLWYTTSKGVVVVNPAQLPKAHKPPSLIVETIRMDGTFLTLSENRIPTPLPPSHRRLEFHFTAPSFNSPLKLRFKYKLVGLDRDWVPDDGSRAAYYSQLPAGHYDFKVAVGTEEGQWNEGPTIRFTVSPFFWQTPWFVVLISLLIIALAAATTRYITRRRMQRRIQAAEQRHALERERTRIAQDIHDDVGASLSKIAMLSQATAQELQQPAEMSATLGHIYATAKEVTTSLDEIVWAVDPSHDSLDSLADYMGRYAQSFLATARIRCRLDLPVQVPAWPVHSESRHHLFLAFKEALANAAKHSGAKEVRISLSLQELTLVVVIADNGAGLPAADDPVNPSARPGGGHGLKNLQHRLTRIHGHCTVSSNPGQGTTVTMQVALPPPPVNPP